MTVQTMDILSTTAQHQEDGIHPTVAEMADRLVKHSGVIAGEDLAAPPVFRKTMLLKLSRDTAHAHIQRYSALTVDEYLRMTQELV